MLGNINKNHFKVKGIFSGIVIFIALPSLFSLTILSSCKKHNPTSAVITVLDSVAGIPVVGATVRLQQDKVAGAVMPSPDRQITNSSGQVTFTLKLVAIYYAEVTKPPRTDTATAIVRFEDEETVDVTIKY